MIKNTLWILLITFFLSGCSGFGHIGFRCKDKKKDDVLKRFGPPMRVDKSIENVETWVYEMGGGVATYTFQGNACIREGSRAQN